MWHIQEVGNNNPMSDQKPIMLPSHSVKMAKHQTHCKNILPARGAEYSNRWTKEERTTLHREALVVTKVDSITLHQEHHLLFEIPLKFTHTSRCV
jgi:arginyl-tRNA--protein-N-Asp/Glu arginylyltransferase